MPRLSQSVPQYRRHRPSGQAFVELNGHRHYLGRHGSRVSHLEYDRLVGEWLQRGRAMPTNQAGIFVVELIVAYLKFARAYYRKAGRPTTEYGAILHAIKPLKQLYGNTPAEAFGPVALQAIMSHMIDQGWSRSTINRQAGRIRRIFKWGAAQELVPVAIYHALATVDGLRKGRTAAKEPRPVLPVDDQIVSKTLEYLPDMVRDMVRFQRYTGCRPGELCRLRPVDVDRSGAVWLYRPAEHKTEHHGRERLIPIGPQAQVILAPYLARDPAAYCFRPMESEARRREKMHAARVTPLSCGDIPGSNRRRHRQRCPGELYDVAAYRRAITRASDLAYPHPELATVPAHALTTKQRQELRAWRAQHRWSPNQLRHRAATDIRRQFGLEAAQIVLGHAKADTTQIYAERDLAKGIEIARRIG